MTSLSDLLTALAEDGATVLFSSHQLDLVQDLCHDVITMDHGRVVLAGSLERLQAAAVSRHINVVFARPPVAGWYSGLADVTVDAADDLHMRLAAGGAADPGEVLRAAQAAGPLLRFGFEPPSLAEMFREAVTP